MASPRCQPIASCARDYNYDYQNRLLAAYYQLPGTAIPRADSYSTEYSYDVNGNILNLKRNGEQDFGDVVIPIDDLVYTYDNVNKLKKVPDLENKPEGFNMNGAGTNVQFQYDTYGNLISDPYKKISNISYNHLNTSTALSTGLPTKITFSSGGKIEYFYDATGGKLKKKVTDGSTITTTDYMDTSATLSTGGFQYTDTKLDFFPHTSTGLSTSAEGYIKAVYGDLGGGGPPSFKYVFTYTDHTSTQLSTGLGNIRLKYTQHPLTGETTILEEDHYYPYGLKHNGYNGEHTVIAYEEDVITLTPVTALFGDSYKYKFGGKEYDDTFDINTYDFGARNYDPALGRWMNIDPLAEKMRRHSPYNYAFDNPVYFIDPDGMMPGGFGGFANIDPVTSTGAIEVSNFGAGNESGKLKSGGESENSSTNETSKNNDANKNENQTDTSSNSGDNQAKELSNKDIKTLGELLGKSPSGKQVIEFIIKTDSKYKNAFVTGKTLEESVEGIKEEASKALGEISKVEKNGNSIVVSGGTKIKVLPAINLKIKDGATFNITKMEANNVIINVSGIKVGILNFNRVEINNTSVKVNIGGFNTSFDLD